MYSDVFINRGSDKYERAEHDNKRKAHKIDLTQVMLLLCLELGFSDYMVLTGRS